MALIGGNEFDLVIESTILSTGMLHLLCSVSACSAMLHLKKSAAFHMNSLPLS